jgi:hypothetical protein
VQLGISALGQKRTSINSLYPRLVRKLP